MIADITGLSANVFYELGVRHRVRPTGTVVVRQKDTAVPFDISFIRTVDYSNESPARAEESRQRLIEVLKRTLAQDEPSVQPA